MKKLIVVFIALGLVLATISVAQAQETISIRLPKLTPNQPDEYTINQGVNVELYTGWGACTPGLAKLWTTVYRGELTVNGELLYDTVTNDPYYTKVEPHENPIVDAPCIIAPSGDKKSVAYWRYPLGVLDLGTYEIHYRGWLVRRITDGYDANYDGELDYYEGERTNRTITITIVESE